MHSRRRAAAALVAATIALILTAGPTFADTSVDHWGKFGPHYLTDTTEYPGGICHFNSSVTLDGIRVRPPVIYARDLVKGRDTQWVGWQIIVRARGLGETTWRTVSTTSVVKAVAHDDQPASLSMRTAAVHHLQAKVIVKMLWYQPGSSSVVQGWAKHRVDVYRDILKPPSPYCEAEHL